MTGMKDEETVGLPHGLSRLDLSDNLLLKLSSPLEVELDVVRTLRRVFPALLPCVLLHLCNDYKA